MAKFKLIIEGDLDEPDDLKLIEQIAAIPRMSSALFEYRHNAWRVNKHTEEPTIEKLEDRIQEIFDDHDLDAVID